MSALTYTGRLSEPYSPLNHFISELGNRTVSINAWVFNFSLIAAGIFFIPFTIGLGFTLKNTWGKIAILAGLWASFSCIAIGVFPMDNLAPHIASAMSYFRSGLATVLFFGISSLCQSQIGGHVPRWAWLVSLPAILAYASFLILAQVVGLGSGVEGSVLDPSWMDSRPPLWPLAIVEWAVFVTTLLWFFGMALVVRKYDTQP